MSILAIGILAFLVMAQTVMVLVLVQEVHELKTDIMLMHKALGIWFIKEDENDKTGGRGDA